MLNQEFILPLVGSVSLFQLLAIGASLVFFFREQLSAKGVAGIVSAVWTFVAGMVKKSEAVPTVVELTPDDDVDEILEALQAMAVWAVKRKSAELLGKVTPLFAELQAHLAKLAAEDKKTP